MRDALVAYDMKGSEHLLKKSRPYFYPTFPTLLVASGGHALFSRFFTQIWG